MAEETSNSQPVNVEEKPQNCIICNNPRPHKFPPFHEECAVCKYCNAEVGRDIIEQLLKQENLENGVYHPYCHNLEMEKRFQQLPVTITQGELDALNVWNLLFEPDLNVSVEVNQQNAEIAASKLYWSKDWNFEQRKMVLKRMEAVTAAFSIALSKDENKSRIVARDNGLVRNTDNERSLERIENEKQRIAKREREAKKLSPAARAEDKAIKVMMGLGMTFEQAVEQIESQKAKRNEKSQSEGTIQ